MGWGRKGVGFVIRANGWPKSSCYQSLWEVANVVEVQGGVPSDGRYLLFSMQGLMHWEGDLLCVPEFRYTIAKLSRWMTSS